LIELTARSEGIHGIAFRPEHPCGTPKSCSVNWWYICPRNVRISIQSQRSLEILAARVDMDDW
jgi:hypothetical protein